MAGIKELSSRREKFRHAKPVYLIICEGRNETEYNYLLNFKVRNSKIIVEPIKCEASDPKSMLKKAQLEYKINDLSKTNGDKAFCLIDVDNKPEKAELLDSLQARYKNIEIIRSNPCIEVWFLFHLQKNPKYLIDGDAAKNELKSIIVNYSESYDIFKKEQQINQFTDTAIQNSRNKKTNYQNLGYSKFSVDNNPYTDMDILISDLKINIE